MIKKLMLLCSVLNGSSLLSMGSGREPYEKANKNKPLSTLHNDQPVYFATVEYKSLAGGAGAGTKTYEGINVDGKVLIPNVQTKMDSFVEDSQIKFEGIKHIFFDSKEKANCINNIPVRIVYTADETAEHKYFVSDKLTFGGWEEGTGRAAICTIEAQNISKMTFFQKIPDADKKQVDEIVGADKETPSSASAKKVSED